MADVDLSALGLENVAEVHRNLSPVHLIEHALRSGEGILADSGALHVTTGRNTGRSPNDKFVVDDPEFSEETRHLGVTGICGSGIIEVVAELYLAGVISQDGVVDGSLREKSSCVVEDGRTFTYVLHEGAQSIRITQNDIRAIQLAKAALYAGIRLLMDRMGVEQVDRIRLAGAFGSHIDVKYAMILGLIPDCELTEVSSAGNAAGTGARSALLNHKARKEIEDVVRRVEKVETAVEPRFQEHFVEAMAIPHKSDAFPELSKEVTLPAPKIIQAKASEGRGRRRSRRRAA